MRNFFSIFTSTLVVLGAITAFDATEHVQRSLILGGSVTPIGSKLYMVGLRTTIESNTFCGGVLISPLHVLTTTSCASNTSSKFAAIGTHYLNGTQDGEVMQIVTVQNHTQYNSSSGAYDFAMLTLEKSSRFSPIKLPKANDSDILVGMRSTTMGWGITSYPHGLNSYELQSVTLMVWSNDDCSSIFPIDVNTSVCAGGAAGKDSCIDDIGGPLVKELGRGDVDDVLIGLSSWGYKCGLDRYPSVYSRVSAALEWIYGITQGKGTRQ